MRYSQKMGRIVDLLQFLSVGAGLLSLGITLVGAFFVVRSGRLQSANTAQSSAISAMQSEMVLLRGRIEDKEKENAQLSQKINHLELTIDTICSALKKRGLVISVQGEMVNIEDKRGSTTTARIRPVRLKDDEAI
jgi:septal ring factor EnvC (AmiA/AmiB activator)